MTAPNDHAGLIYLLDATGRTIEQLEHRVGALTSQVASIAAERDQLRRTLEAVLASATPDVPPVEKIDPENGAHDTPPPPPE